MITLKNPIFFVGAGPGNPDLITVKGMKLIQDADVIFYDALIDFEGFQELNKSANWIFVGKRAGKVSIDQKLIGKLLLITTKIIIKLYDSKGRPSIFGRLTEEIVALNKYDIPFEIVPGVTAGLACGRIKC